MSFALNWNTKQTILCTYLEISKQLLWFISFYDYFSMFKIKTCFNCSYLNHGQMLFELRYTSKYDIIRASGSKKLWYKWKFINSDLPIEKNYLLCQRSPNCSELVPIRLVALVFANEQLLKSNTFENLLNSCTNSIRKPYNQYLKSV